MKGLFFVFGFLARTCVDLFSALVDSLGFISGEFLVV